MIYFLSTISPSLSLFLCLDRCLPKQISEINIFVFINYVNMMMKCNEKEFLLFSRINLDPL